MAQTVRGVIVDGASGLPVSNVAVALLDDAGASQPPTRSDTLGAFILHAPRMGQWRVRATRIGYAPAESESLKLGAGSLVVVRLRLLAVARQLSPVEIVERRKLNARELMSTLGFDLRAARGYGQRLDTADLARYKYDLISDIIATRFGAFVFFETDETGQQKLRIRRAGAGCDPELYIDGNYHSGAAFDMTMMPSLTADQLYGVEVYVGDVLPPSLGGFFGTTYVKVPGRKVPEVCGTVAIWTKAGRAAMPSEISNSSGRSALQAISGTLVDFDTGDPLGGREVSLLSRDRDRIGDPVVTNDRGEFIVRVPRSGELRLQAGGKGYLESTSPPLLISPDELVVVRLSISAHEGVLAPLGVSARVGPQDIAITSIAGFTYRRERAVAGEFFDAADLARSGSRTVGDFLTELGGAAVRVGQNGQSGLVLPGKHGEAECAASIYLDGGRVATATAVTALPATGVFGIEVYLKRSQIPQLFLDDGACGVIVVWQVRTSPK
jgi:hypothetical protein